MSRKYVKRSTRGSIGGEWRSIYGRTRANDGSVRLLSPLLRQTYRYTHYAMGRESPFHIKNKYGRNGYIILG